MTQGSGGSDEGSSGRESLKDSLRRFLESRSAFSGLSRPELEQLVTDFLRGDGKGRERLEDVFEEFRARSRKSVDRIGDLVRSEVRREFGSFSSSRRDDIGDFFERLVSLIGEYFGPGRSKEHARREGTIESIAKAAKRSAAKRTATKKAPPKKSAAKKSPAKKSPAKKAAKKAPPSAS